jgi:imidazolonepropionase
MLDKADILIKNASEFVTLAGSKAPRIKEQMKELGIIEDGCLAIRGNKIIAVGRTNEVEKKVEVDKKTMIIDASGKTVMPGFVDPHTHIIFAGSREDELALKIEGATYLEILEKGGGILSTVKKTREASKEDLMNSAKKRLDTMLRFGTTTAEVKSGYGLTAEDEIKCLEVIKELNEIHPIDLVPTFLGAHVIPPEYENNGDGYIDWIINEILPVIKERRLAEYCDVFCEKNVFSIAQSRRLLTEAMNLGLKAKIHADEITDLGGAELAAEINAKTADHLLRSSDRGIKAMVKRGVMGVLLPAVPFALMEKEYADARKMVDNGLAIALATDLNPNCWTESMQFIIALACYQMRMSVEEAITASTINAAHAIDRANDIGSLEVEKKADVIILDIPNHKHLPYHFGVNLVEKVIKDGRMVIDK